MSEDTPDKRPLSEIGHLFLSSLRERQDAPRPQRIGPQSTDLTADPYPNDFAPLPPPPPPAPPAKAPSTLNGDETPAIARVLLGGNIDGEPSSHGRYAAHLARQGRRVGLIEIDGLTLRVTIFERRSSNEYSSLPENRTWTAAAVRESLDELAWDVPCWLIAPSNGRPAESRTLLSAANHWTLITSGQRDAIVGAYRALKGAADPVVRNQARVPVVSLALLGDAGETSDRIHAKLASVCLQFLGIDIIREEPVGPDSDDVIANIALETQPELTEPPTVWESVIADFIRGLDRADENEEAPPVAVAPPIAMPKPAPIQKPAAAPRPAPVPQASAPQNTVAIADNTAADDLPTEVIDLPPGATTAEIVRASIAGATDLAACPIQVPMCPSAGVAVGRDRRLTLVAAAQAPLSDLRAIAGALRWLADSRALVAMALPQLSIDLDRLPALRLLIDRRDLGAQSLDPLIHSERVTVQTYRRLSWSGKIGLLLDAA